MSDATVAVVGTGPAGLAVAWTLTGAGVPVRMYDCGSRVGGRFRTEEVAGAQADPVVQLLSDGYTETLDLMADMGLRDRVVPVPGRDAIWRGGRAHTLRYGSASSMAASSAVPTTLKLRLGLRYLPFLERHGDVLDLNEPARAGALDDQSIGAWGRSQLGEDFVELLVYPLLAAYYGLTPEETGAGFFHALARAGTHVEVLGVRGGFGALAGDMAKALQDRGVEIHLRRSVTAVGQGTDGVTLDTADGPERHRAVVLAVPPGAAAGLLPRVPWLTDIPTRPMATLVLALDGTLDTGWFGLTVPRRSRSGGPVAAVCVQSAKETGLAGEALVVVPTPEAGREWAASDADTVRAQVLPVLDRLLPGIWGRIRGERLVTLADPVFIPEPGHFSDLARRDPEVMPGVILAGDYWVSPTVEGAVRSGRTAALRLTAGETG